METDFNTLICEEDSLEHPADNYFHQGRQQVHSYQKTYVSICSPAAVGLTILAVVLLMLNIGLGVYHSTLKDTHLTPEDIEQISNE
uniref:Uncharacterized protein n=1 Tax=Tetraodon nigroviridis TaxID=99883 RepID=H3BYP8_TETNG